MNKNILFFTLSLLSFALGGQQNFRFFIEGDLINRYSEGPYYNYDYNDYKLHYANGIGLGIEIEQGRRFFSRIKGIQTDVSYQNIFTSMDVEGRGFELELGAFQRLLKYKRLSLWAGPSLIWEQVKNTGSRFTDGGPPWEFDVNHRRTLFGAAAIGKLDLRIHQSLHLTFESRYRSDRVHYSNYDFSEDYLPNRHRNFNPINMVGLRYTIPKLY